MYYGPKLFELKLRSGGGLGKKNKVVQRIIHFFRTWYQPKPKARQIDGLAYLDIAALHNAQSRMKSLMTNLSNLSRIDVD